MSSELAIHGGTPVRENKLPFGAPFFGEEEIAEVVDTLRSGWITTGPKTKQFESEFADYVGSRFAVALNSCTAGLHLSLVVLGVGAGDDVLVPALTFGATANVVEHVRAHPIFVDVDPVTLCMDPCALERSITSRAKVILPVDYAGMPCDLDAINAIARAHNLYVVEDAAHAIGARYKGRMIGSVSLLTNFSFYANKNLSTAEGGMVTTDDQTIEEKLRVYHLHGLSRDAWKRYHVRTYTPPEIVVPGFKYNMTDLQASLGLHQLRKQNQFLFRREKIAACYDAAFRGLSDLVRTQPRAADGCTRHALHFYPLLLNLERFIVSRDQVLNALLAENIGVSVHFQPLHQMPFYRHKYGYAAEDLPNAAHVGMSEVSLPLQPQMTDRDVEDVVESVYKVFQVYAK